MTRCLIDIRQKLDFADGCVLRPLVSFVISLLDVDLLPFLMYSSSVYEP